MEQMDKKLSYEEAIERAGDALHRFRLMKIRGIPLMEHIAQNWSSIWAFRPDPSDLLISTYPKAGTTWTQEIVDLLLNNGDPDVSKRAPIPVRIPFLEIFSPPPIPSGLDLLKDMDPPRVIKTHLPIQLVPEGFWENKCKVIYVARNAKDNLVSYYHFDRMNQTQPEPGPWDGYIRKFMKGDLSWGSWYDHVKGYWKERERRNILYLFYEDMKENPRQEIIRIMKYLDLSLSDDIIDRIVQLTSFKAMKDNPMANYSFMPKPVFDQSISPFMRKGLSNTAFMLVANLDDPTLKIPTTQKKRVHEISSENKHRKCINKLLELPTMVEQEGKCLGQLNAVNSEVWSSKVGIVPLPSCMTHDTSMLNISYRSNFRVQF